MKTIYIIRVKDKEFIIMSCPKITCLYSTFEGISLKTHKLMKIRVPLSETDVEMREPRNESEYIAMKNIIKNVEQDIAAEKSANEMISQIVHEGMDLFKIDETIMKQTIFKKYL